LSYPNIEDAERGLKNGLITQAEHDEIVKAINEKAMPPQKTKLGGEIYIHGGGCKADWTAGCMALDNEEMQEIFEAIEVGTAVKIVP
jgi:L,D-peptidoglycan transpeptidase YkuD (ErfK/YbiS/YcfS/YnhG family)